MPPAAVVKDSLTTAADGKRYSTKLYNLDAILAVGYRVRSPRGMAGELVTGLGPQLFPGWGDSTGHQSVSQLLISRNAGPDVPDVSQSGEPTERMPIRGSIRLTYHVPFPILVSIGRLERWQKLI